MLVAATAGLVVLFVVRLRRRRPAPEGAAAPFPAEPDRRRRTDRQPSERQQTERQRTGRQEPYAAGAFAPPEAGPAERPPAEDVIFEPVFRPGAPGVPEAAAPPAPFARPLPSGQHVPAVPAVAAMADPADGPAGSPPPAPGRRRSAARRPALLAGALALALAAAGGVTWLTLSADDDGGTPLAAPGTGATASAAPPMAPVAYAKVADRAGGTLTRMTLTGRESGVRADVWVWLPPQYGRPEYRDTRFPVLVAHSGYPGVGASTMVDGDVGLIAKVADAIQAGTMPPALVVAPELLPYDTAPAGPAAASDLDCSDIPGRPRIATFHTTDVRDAVLATFRAAPDRASWGLIGEGTGGLCAVKYALQYPRYYAGAASLSGRTTPRSTLWGADPEGVRARTANTPATLLAARPDVRLLLSTGAADQEGRAANAQLASSAQAPTQVRVSATASGTGATAAEVARQVPEALVFLGRVVSGPAGPGPAQSADTRPPSAAASPGRGSRTPAR